MPGEQRQPCGIPFGEYMSTGQFVHADALDSVNLPEGHTLQHVSLSPLKEPAGQGRQCDV